MHRAHLDRIFSTFTQDLNLAVVEAAPLAPGQGGCFCPDLTARPSIYILKTMPNHKKCATFFHELGHYHCWKNNCRCYGSVPGVKNKKIMSEVHANRFALKSLYDLGERQALSVLMKCIVRWSKDSNLPRSYVRSSKRVMGSAIWKKCIILYEQT